MGMNVPLIRYILLTLVIAAVYFAAAALGLSLAFLHTSVSPVWPPTGIAIAALLIFGRRYWPAVFIGAFAANETTDVTALTAAGIAVGNTLEAVTAFELLNRAGIGDRPLETISRFLKFVLFAVLLSPITSATIGNISLVVGSAAEWSDFWRLWLTWWLGDAMGALIVTPFLLSWRSGPKAFPTSTSLVEAVVLLAGLFLMGMVTLGGWFPGDYKNYSLAHLTLPFLVWAALRFDHRLLTSAVILLSGVAIWGTLNGYGPFALGDPNQSLLVLQVFVASSTLTALVVCAVISERRVVQQEKLALGEEVARERKRLSEIVSHVPGVVWEAWGRPDAATQRIDFVSSHVESMLGYSEAEWLSTPNFWLSLVHPDDKERTAKEAAAIFESRKGGVSRFRWLAKDGRVIPVEAQSVVVCDENGAALGMRGVTMDITPAVKAEHEIANLLQRERVARAQAEEASRLKDEFLATVSHELRTPLNAIVGWSRILRTEHLEKKDWEHALEVIERNALSQKQLVEDMLDVSRIITGKLRLKLTPIALEEVVQAAVDAIHPAAHAREIKIHTKTTTAGLVVQGDPDRLQQVAWNLLSNAVKFSEPGSQVEISMGSSNGRVQLTVTDHGPGIDPEFLPRAFDRFTQADGSSTRRYGGLGLGLAIVRHLVELHGGTVEASNRNEAKGATFTVSLPSSLSE